MKNLYREYRCKNDGKLLFKGIIVESEIEIKCKACHELNVIHGEDMKDLICLRSECLNRLRYTA